MNFKYAIFENGKLDNKSGSFILPGRYETKNEAEINLNILLKASPQKSFTIKTIENGIWE